MTHFDRRRFLQTTGVMLAGGSATWTLAADDAPLKPATDKPSEPIATLLTWQSDPTTTMTVQWVAADNQAALPILYSKSATPVWQPQAATAGRFPLTDLWLMRAELTGLAPGTDYQFRVGSAGALERFRTMPAKANNTLQFVSGGDSGIGPNAVMTNRIAAVQRPAFVVLGGDIAYENGRSPEVFLEFLKNYSRDLRDDQNRLIPLLGCIGNHEVDGGYEKTRREAPFFYAIFDGLFRDTGYASLDFGDYMSLIFLDTNHTTPIEGEQTAWLAQSLREREENPNVFVFNHVPAYPSHRPFVTSAGEPGTGAENRKHWAPLFERYNVDAVFEHHDHTYKRTHPLLDGHVNAGGVLYLGDGSWGKIRPPVKPEDRPYLAVTEEAYHLSVHRIEGPRRFHIALSDTGRVVDVCTTTKRPQGGKT